MDDIDFIFSITGKRIELDILIPSLLLAFEYQGEQHYKDHFFGKINQRNQIDQEKKLICNQIGITLIEIPYWNDLDLISLKNKIISVRSDIIF